MSDITRKEREELNALSKEVFNVSSKWQKFFKGVPELVTKTVKEVVPGDKGAPDTEKEVVVPVLLDGAKQYKTRSYSVEEIRKLLVDAKAQRDAYLAKIKEQQALAEVQKKIQEQASGKTEAL
jgi:hypothetical protein